MENNKTICIVGIGNPLRGDDGVAAHVCGLIEQDQFVGVSVIIQHQLDVSMAEALSTFDVVVIVDASVEEKTVSLGKIPLTDNQPQAFSHHVNAAMLMNVTKALYPGNTQFYLCAIGVSGFDMGDKISAAALKNASEAVAEITAMIRQLN